MGLFRRWRRSRSDEKEGPPPDELVGSFLRGQNLEQVGRVEEAVELYEEAVAGAFDAAGPYDRLLFIYEEQRRHREVIRVSEAALESVRTYPAKLNWYREQIAQARQQLHKTPKPR